MALSHLVRSISPRSMASLSWRGRRGHRLRLSPRLPGRSRLLLLSASRSQELLPWTFLEKPLASGVEQSKSALNLPNDLPLSHCSLTALLMLLLFNSHSRQDHTELRNSHSHTPPRCHSNASSLSRRMATKIHIRPHINSLFPLFPLRR